MMHSSVRWLLPLGGILTLAGYFGPWVPHRVAGLVVTGLDLAEYVKFLPAVRNGEVMVWREGFYLPLLAVSLSFSLIVFRSSLDYGWPLRALLIAGASVAALNMLPPAWAPWKLRLPEFQLQSAAILFCLAIMLISPFLALIPSRYISLLILALSVAALIVPLRYFWRILPDISQLYNHPIQPGWGLYLMGLGVTFLGWGGIGTGMWSRRDA